MKRARVNRSKPRVLRNSSGRVTPVTLVTSAMMPSRAGLLGGVIIFIHWFRVNCFGWKFFGVGKWDKGIIPDGGAAVDGGLGFSFVYLEIKQEVAVGLRELHDQQVLLGHEPEQADEGHAAELADALALDQFVMGD